MSKIASLLNQLEDELHKKRQRELQSRLGEANNTIKSLQKQFEECQKQRKKDVEKYERVMYKLKEENELLRHPKQRTVVQQGTEGVELQPTSGTSSGINIKPGFIKGM